MAEARGDAVTALLTGDMVERLRQLEIFSRLRVEGRRAGDNRSPLAGFSPDFLQHRQYFPGDDLRRLDWRVLARTDRLVIRQYEELSNAELAVVLDCSGSMAYAGPGMSKHEYAVRCAAILLYLTFLRRDDFSLFLFAEDAAARVPPGGTRLRLRQVFEKLVASRPSGETRFAACFQEVEARLLRRGIVVVLSDFMSDPEKLGQALGRLRLRGHDVVALMIFDPTERELAQIDFTRFRDLENGELVSVDPLPIRDEYQRQFERHQVRLREQCLAHGIDFAALPVGDDYEAALGLYLRRRMRLVAR
ncbi:MAG: DUF58 domain-containing protein [Planctomycetota bacterium]